MSYEYRLVFDDLLSARHVMDGLRASAACVRADEAFVHLKDHELRSSADYDLRLIHEGEQALWLDLLFGSTVLYQLLQGVLQGCAFKCFEDGDVDAEVRLDEVFRVKDVGCPPF